MDTGPLKPLGQWTPMPVPRSNENPHPLPPDLPKRRRDERTGPPADTDDEPATDDAPPAGGHLIDRLV